LKAVFNSGFQYATFDDHYLNFKAHRGVQHLLQIQRWRVNQFVRGHITRMAPAIFLASYQIPHCWKAINWMWTCISVAVWWKF